MKKKTDPARNNLLIGSPAHDCWQLLETITPDEHWFEVPPGEISPKPPILRATPTETPSRIAHHLRNIPCLKFQHVRHTGEGIRANSSGSALTIEFLQAVSLPIGLGYGAHFGLGLFIHA